MHKHRTRIWRQGAPWRQGEIWRQGGSTRKPLAGKLWRLMGGGEGEGDEDENALKSADRLEGGGGREGRDEGGEGDANTSQTRPLSECPSKTRGRKTNKIVLNSKETWFHIFEMKHFLPLVKLLTFYIHFHPLDSGVVSTQYMQFAGIIDLTSDHKVCLLVRRY